MVNKNFVKFSEGQQHWWYTGAFSSIAHVVSSQYGDKESDCVWRWYFDHPEKRKKQLMESFKAYPEHAPTTVIIALLKRDCGVFQ
ncbi:hypothetical protein DXX93_10360 [Thalassotalea euphylliae]|uniref:Uncharacterized protein n=2 Tax=Thalassotalea euphylliae TaxID=1655234 RepID=A0A3E0TQL1_9GAMM|nr:hypothetical protein DXX93_10360 [Thalassotalea euphylliae]